MLAANPQVVGDLHLRVMRLVAHVADSRDVSSLRLEGGTALSAYYLGHRESEDLDFFSDISVDAGGLGEALAEAGAAEGLRFERGGTHSPTFARYVVTDTGGTGESLKLDLAAQSPFRLEPLRATAEGIRVASFRDLAAGKLHAICDRTEARDFIDLHVILTRDAEGEDREATIRARTRDLVGDVIECDPGLNPRLVGDAVSRMTSRPVLSAFPLRLLIRVTDLQLHETLRIFADECAVLVAESLPS